MRFEVVIIVALILGPLALMITNTGKEDVSEVQLAESEGTSNTATVIDESTSLVDSESDTGNASVEKEDSNGEVAAEEEKESKRIPYLFLAFSVIILNFTTGSAMRGSDSFGYG